jgi:hypothetical protein
MEGGGGGIGEREKLMGTLLVGGRAGEVLLTEG